MTESGSRTFSQNSEGSYAWHERLGGLRNRPPHPSREVLRPEVSRPAALAAISAIAQELFRGGFIQQPPWNSPVRSARIRTCAVRRMRNWGKAGEAEWYCSLGLVV